MKLSDILYLIEALKKKNIKTNQKIMFLFNKLSFLTSPEPLVPSCDLLVGNRCPTALFNFGTIFLLYVLCFFLCVCVLNRNILLRVYWAGSSGSSGYVMKSTDLGSSSFCLKRSIQYCIMQKKKKTKNKSKLDTKNNNYLQSPWVNFFSIYLLTYSVLTADCIKMSKFEMKHLNNELLYKQGDRLVAV